MRGVVVFVTGLLVLTAVVMMAGMILEPVAAVVMEDPAIQSLGWAGEAADIRDTILRWMPLLYIAYLLTWAGMWAFRRERGTEVVRR